MSKKAFDKIARGMSEWATDVRPQAWYELTLQPDGDTWLVTSPDFEEVATFGDNQEAACRNGRDAILQAIAGRIADNEDIPAARPEHPGKGFFVEVSGR